MLESAYASVVHVTITPSASARGSHVAHAPITAYACAAQLIPDPPEKRAYQLRVQAEDVEQSSFTTLVLSATGGMGAEATIFYKRLAAMLTQKWETPYSKTLYWLRCHLIMSYSLIRSAIQALRGARSSRGLVSTRERES